jgi:hypothetical protein
LRSCFTEELERCESYGEIFDLVKKSVKKVLGLHRAGLLLYLKSLPLKVGAYYQTGSNSIVLNKLLIDVMSKVLISRNDYKSFIFSLLLHEYLHSLGFLDENKVRWLAYKICRESFGEDHPTVKMSLEPPAPTILGYRDERYLDSGDMEIIRNFEKIEHSYIA